ncbi:MAG: nucleoside triphosphate pyrophosphohydrolase [Desulfuromonadia bacterium]
MKSIETNGFDRLVAIMERLRNPGGCPWDAEQTHESLKRYLLEECYEVLEAIDQQNDEHLKEELGDLLLQSVFHASIAAARGAFTINDVIDAITEKLIRRHPHVFGDMVIRTSGEQLENWEKIKRSEKKGERSSALAGVPPHLPSLLRAQKVTEKASRVGFDWSSVDQVMEKVLEELHEFEDAIADGDQRRMEEELGDLLFSIVNLGRFLSLDPEDALRKTIDKFTRRFSHIESGLVSMGRSLHEATLEEMEALWIEAKEAEERS